MFKHIFVPTDGSELSRATAQRAVSFAKEAGARITVFFCQAGIPDRLLRRRRADRPDDAGQICRAGRPAGQRIPRRSGQTCADAGVECSTVSATSDVPYEAIIEAAEKSGCDLIFMASHGRRGISGLLAGQRDQQGADPLQGAGAGLSLSRLNGRCSATAPGRCGTAPRRWPCR
jgi:nucleotide-binding universal stress UspA family protein